MNHEQRSIIRRHREPRRSSNSNEVKIKRFYSKEWAEAFTKQRKMEMIHEIGQVPYLYNKKHPLYKNARIKKEKWARLAQEYGMHNPEKYWIDTLKKSYMSAKKAYMKEFESSNGIKSEGDDEEWNAAQQKAYKDFMRSETNVAIHAFMLHDETCSENNINCDSYEDHSEVTYSLEETDSNVPEQSFYEMTSMAPLVSISDTSLEPVHRGSSEISRDSRQSRTSSSSSPYHTHSKRQHRKMPTMNSASTELQTLLACATKYSTESIAGTSRPLNTIGRLLGEEVEAAYEMSPRHRQIQFKADIQALITANEKAIFEETV